MAVVASVSGLNAAQPQVAVAFDASQGDVLWMINIYTVTLAALLLPLGAVLTTGYGDAIDPHLEGIPAEAAATARKGSASVLAMGDEPRPYSEALLLSAQESFVHCWRQAMWAGVVVMAILPAYVLVREPRRERPL
jgi:hypothetical protein